MSDELGSDPSGSRSDAEFSLVARAVERGRVSREAVEAALREGRPLLAALGLGAEELRALGALPRATALPPEVVAAERDPERRIGRYVVLEELRAGGMGRVFRAWDALLERTVALKVPKHALDEAARERLVREAQLAASLDHPGIAHVHEVGEHGGAPFIAMQFVSGRTLRDAMRTVPREELVRHWRDAAAAVDYAHRRGIVHRDLKPENVMLDGEGRVVVLDFGLARETSGEGSLGTTGLIAGTPHYMAPEQAIGRASPSSDVYSVGASLYEAVTGRPPFLGETAAHVLARVLREEPPLPRLLAPDVSRDLEAVLLHCLEKDPGRRYADMASLLDDLDAYLARAPLRHARRATPLYVLERSVRREPLAWALGAAALAALVLGVVTGVASLVSRNELLRGQLATDRERSRVERLLRAHDRASLLELELGRAFSASERDGERETAAALAAAAVGSGAVTLLRELASIEPATPAERSELDALARRALDVQRSTETLLLFAMSGLVNERGPTLVGRAPRPGGGVAFTPDGAYLLAGLDHLGVLWERRSGRPVRVFAGATDRILACALSPDGEHVALASRDGSVRVFETATGRVEQILAGHRGPVNACAFSPDGRALLSGAEDGTLVLRDRASGELVRTLDAGAPVLAAAFAKDGTRIAAGTRAHTVSVWHRSGELVGTRTLDEPVHAIAFSSRGDVVAASGRQLVRLDASSGSVRALARAEAGILSLAVSPEGGELVLGLTAGTAAGSVLVVDAETGATRAVLAAALGPVSACAVSPDGGEIAAASESARSLSLVERASGRTTRSFGAVEPAIAACTLSPDGRTVVAGTGSGELRLIDRASGRLVRSIASGHGEVLAVAVSPESTRILAGMRDGTLELRDRATGSLVCGLAHGGPVSACGFSPDGAHFLSASWDGSVALFEAGTGAPVRTLTGHGDRVLGAAFSPDGERIATACADRKLRIFDRASGELTASVSDRRSPFWGAAFSPDGRTVAAFNPDGGLVFVDARTGARGTSPLGPTNALLALAFAPDGTEVVGAATDGALEVWDRATEKRKGALEGHADAVTACAFSADGLELLSASNDGTIRFRGSELGRELSPPIEAHRGHVLSVAFSPDGTRFATTGTEAQPEAKVFERASGRLLHTFAGDRSALAAIAWAPDGRSLATVCVDGSVALWDEATGRRTRTLEGHGEAALACAFSPDGSELASGSQDRTVRLWRTDGAAVRVIPAHADMVTAVAYSPDGRQLLTGSLDRTMRLWDLGTLRLVRAFEGHSGAVMTCAFSPDGRDVLSGSLDGTLRIWDGATGAVRRVLDSRTKQVQRGVFAPDGRMVASASADGTLSLWDRASGRLLRTITSPAGYPTGCAFSPDGRVLVSSWHDRLVRVHRVAPHVPFEALVPGYALDPVGAVGRLLANVSATGRPGEPLPGDLPVLAPVK